MFAISTGDFMVSVDLGPWIGADLHGTVRQLNGVGSDDDLSVSVRFMRNVSRLVRKRLHSHLAHMRRDAVAIFLLGAQPPTPSPNPRIPMLGNGETEIAGRVWFVSEIAQSGRYFELAENDDSSVFDYVIDTLGCGDTRAILYNPRLETPELRFYPNGLSQEENVFLLAISDSIVTLQEILSVIERTHEASFITPDAQIAKGSSMWEDNNLHWVARDAEAIAQAHLKTALAIRFTDCNIRHEQPMTVGRVDLEIEQPDPDNGMNISRPAVIEVKVLRSHGSTGRATRPDAIPRWISRGVRQVAAYRDDRHALNGILCCFDMRVTDSGQNCFSHVEAAAQARNVVLARWYVYHTAEAYRVARYGVP